MSYFPIDVEGLVQRGTLGSRADDPQITPRARRRLPHLRFSRRRRTRTSAQPQPQPQRG
jgi:hypothetical protein